MHMRSDPLAKKVLARALIYLEHAYEGYVGLSGLL